MSGAFDASGLQYVWDSTSIKAAKKCPRYYQHKMLDNLRLKNKSIHLVFGGTYASALELFYKERAAGADIADATRAAIKFAMTDSWDADKGKQLDVYDEETNKTRPNLIRTIVWYIEQYGDEQEGGLKTYHLQNGEAAVELSFKVEVEDGIIFSGHLDRVVDMAGRLYVMDQKTTKSTPGTYYFRGFDLDDQMSMYPWAGQIVLHSPIRGVIIDAAQIAVGFSRFERGITMRTKAQLNEWSAGALEVIHRTRHYTETEFFPQNFTACSQYGQCEFAVLCSNDPSIRQSYIESDFEREVWDPSESR